MQGHGDWIASLVVAEHDQSCVAGLAVGLGIREERLVSRELLVFTRVADTGGVQLVDLEPKQVDLTRTCAFVTPERRQLGIQFGQSRSSSPQGFQIDPTEFIECRSLRGHRQQALMGMLTVEVDELTCQLRQ